MKTQMIKKNKGFTLVETMFAIYILTFTIVGLMTVVANSLFAARYAKDEITVNYLLQEVIDYVRNDRDTTVFLEASAGSSTWTNFLTKYNKCSTTDGCYFDVLPNILANYPIIQKNCPSSICPFLYYNEKATNTPFYVNGDGGGMLKTNFQRKIVVKQNTNRDEVDVTVTVTWKNGGMLMNRSLSTSLMNWQK